MSNHTRGPRCLLAALVGLSVAFMAAATPAAAARFDLAAELEKLRRLGVPGVMAYVRKGSHASMAAVGLSSVAPRRPLQGTEVWRIASVTKLITGIVVQKLAIDRQIHLDDAIGKYLPGVVPLADRITIRQLLNHTAGVPDYLAGQKVPVNVSAARLRANLVRNRPRNQLISDANQQPRQFEPGAMHDYSNTNYLVLEMLIEKVAGKPYRDIVREELIEPLHLKHTGFPDAAGRIPEPNVRGYVPSDGPKGPFTNHKKLVDVTAHDYFTGADGGLYSSIPDLARIMAALWSGNLLKPEELAGMLKDLQEDHDGTYRYGLGVTVLPTKCRRQVFGHEGRDLGTLTLMFATGDGDRQLVLVLNSAADYVPRLDLALSRFRDRVFCDM